jgi:Protein of unknown function (DUF2817)
MSFELDDCFASTFSGAREKFLGSARALGAQHRKYAHPSRGPNGGELATDVATFGDPRAKHLLVLVSGTHGVEGYCGSGLQVAHMRSGVVRDLGSDLAIKMVHALNPHGFAYKRRVSECNVDLNRNFIDFSRMPKYEELHRLTTPPTFGGRFRRKLGLVSYIVSRGMRALQTAVTHGQYEYSDGLFFGGASPSWSRQTWDSILEDCSASQCVVIIDYHTGLGPRGIGELISPLDEVPNSWRARATCACFGHNVKSLKEPVSPEASGDLSVSAEVSGDLLSYTFLRKDLQTAGAFLEFGTVPGLKVLDALIDENWAHHNPSTDKSSALRERLLQVFTPDDAEWRKAVWTKALATTKSAINGLTVLSQQRQQAWLSLLKDSRCHAAAGELPF